MRLTGLQLTNFQAVDSLTLKEIAPFATVLGPPHSGKTSILESLFFQFNHESLEDTRVYFDYLNRTLASGRFYAIQSTFDDRDGQYRCETRITLQGDAASTESSVWHGDQQLSEADERLFFDRVRRMLKFHAGSETDKRVFFPGPREAVVERRARLLAELVELQASPRAGAFIDGLRTVFPNVPLHATPNELLEFFGTGFYHTLKLFVYLYHPSIAVVLIDEPEIYLYPSLTQRFLTLVLAETQQNPEKQVIIASHSPVLLQADVTHFYLTRERTGRTRVDRVRSEDLASRFDLIGAKPADTLASEMILYVEGPSDIGIYEEFLKKYPELAHLTISVFQLGGDSMGHDEIDPAKLKRHNPLSFAIIDSERRRPNGDPDPAHQRFIDRCYHAHLYCKMLERAAIENYFTERALRAYYRSRHFPNGFRVQPYRSLKRQGIGWYEKSHARGIARCMTRDEIEACPDLKSFFGELSAAATSIASHR